MIQHFSLPRMISVVSSSSMANKRLHIHFNNPTVYICKWDNLNTGISVKQSASYTSHIFVQAILKFHYWHISLVAPWTLWVRHRRGTHSICSTGVSVTTDWKRWVTCFQCTIAEMCGDPESLSCNQEIYIWWPECWGSGHPSAHRKCGDDWGQDEAGPQDHDQGNHKLQQHKEHS